MHVTMKMVVKSLTLSRVLGWLTPCFSVRPTFAVQLATVIMLMPFLVQSVLRILIVCFALGFQLLESWIPFLAELKIRI